MEKSKSMVWRMLAILIIAFLWGGGLGAYAAKKAWVKINGTSLYFYYGEKDSLGTDEYELDDYNPNTDAPRWNYSKTRSVTFDKSFAEARPTTCHKWFHQLVFLSSIRGLENLNTSEVTDMSYMFSACQSLTYLDVSTFKTEKVRDMSYMFQKMYTMMIQNWNLGKKLTEIKGLDKFNTSQVTNMRNMFAGTKSLESLNVSAFNTEKVLYMDHMFENLSKLTEIKGLENFNTTKVQNMASMFSGCSALTSLNVSAFNAAEVLFMDQMFENLSSLTEIKGLENLNASKVQSLASMFSGCSALTSLDLSDFKTIMTKNMSKLFYDCPNLQSIYLGEEFVTDAVERSGAYTDMFALLDGGVNNAIVYNRQSTSVGKLKNPLFADRVVRTYIPINVQAEYGTICVPVGSTLAKGSFTGFDKLYMVTEVDKSLGTIILQEAQILASGVPYVYHHNVVEGDVEGKIVYNADAPAAVTAPKNENSFLKGTFESMVAKGGSYILQMDGCFHPVADDNKTLTVGAYRAYLELPGMDEETGNSKAYRMVFKDGEATGIDRIDADGSDKGVDESFDQQPKVYFDLTGRKVKTPRKGEIYIVKGRKVVYQD